MSGRLIRVLCLGCGVLLALPPAWCCYTPAQPVAAPAEPAPPAHDCCHAAKPKPSEPAPSSPSRPERCPCDDRNTVAPAAPEKPTPGPSLPAPSTVAAAETPATGPTLALTANPPAPSRPLHLLRCVWLC